MKVSGIPMQYRVRQLNALALLLAVAYALAAIKYTQSVTQISPWIRDIFVYATSIGVYRIIIDVIFRIVERTTFFRRLYWGQLHIAGLWSYSYTIEGAPERTVYFGVWRFEQTLFATSVVGFGLTDEFDTRSHVRSVTDVISNGNAYEVINVRSDSVNSEAEVFSRTTMFFEQSSARFFKQPDRMRGKTFVYGGPLTGRICNNTFVRHVKARTEQDVIDELRHNLNEHGHVHGAVVRVVAS
ncbi:hypothetical protein PHK61_06585 [Actinomycetospora lutea]|uniref:hypothetical protein n=1 Tax=Actinomycetospora lutea TaxID=663604 RepID=UPI002364FFED|nr:hypothetical protein [Actinomycetospora lutea]MDD7938082.1 hypothetical protein [Actinomycetospora lutea]